MKAINTPLSFVATPVCTQGIFLMVHGEPLRVMGLNPGQPHAKQMTHSLYYFSGSNILYFSLEKSCLIHAFTAIVKKKATITGRLETLRIIVYIGGYLLLEVMK